MISEMFSSMNSMDFVFPSNPMEIHYECSCVPLNSMELLRTEFHGKFPLNSMQQLHGAISVEFHVLKLTPWNSIEFHGFPWKIFHGVPWGYFTIFKVVVLTWVLLYMYSHVHFKLNLIFNISL